MSQSYLLGLAAYLHIQGHHHSVSQTAELLHSLPYDGKSVCWNLNLQLLPSMCNSGCKTAPALCSPAPLLGDEGARTPNHQ